MRGDEAMLKPGRILLLLVIVQLVVFTSRCLADDKPSDNVSAKTRCTVCGMFVAKYPNWLAQIQYTDPEKTEFFDGVKDMMVFYFNPERFGGGPREAISAIFVKDYYTLTWTPAKEAFYVFGSDVFGPMGHELIPFASREAAESFSRDHHGKQIFTFGAVTPELIESLRSGQNMR
jgi:copper chaperone NosL